MTKTELLEIVRNGENSGVEFKRDTIEGRALAKELVAFANLRGGKVLLGVEDDGSIVGITRINCEEWVMTACRDKVRPEIIPYFEIVRDVVDGRDVAVVDVERSYTVHHVWHDHHRTYCIRVGTQSREMSQEELARLLQQRGGVRADVRPVTGTTIDDLDRRRLTDYFYRIRGQSVPDNEEGWRTLLINTEILDSGERSSSATLSGLLLFGRTPNRFLPQAGITAVAFKGKDKSYDIADKASLRGPMVPLMNESGLLIENGLVEQAIEFVHRNTHVTGVLEGGTRRITTREYPDDAIRETVVNALVHRDYLLSGTDIELSIYDDRLEILSPGRLPNAITIERMRTGCRAARNQLLRDTMADYNYVEQLGMGIPRKIIRSMHEHNGTDPDLVLIQEETFLVRLHKS